MYNKARLLFIAMFLFSTNSYTLKFKLPTFRFQRYVYYEILYKIQGIKINEFDNVQIIEETPNKLVFEYSGKQYTAHNLTKGSIKVEMPEGLQDRYLTRTSTPDLILAQYY